MSQALRKDGFDKTALVLTLMAAFSHISTAHAAEDSMAGRGSLLEGVASHPNVSSVVRRHLADRNGRIMMTDATPEFMTRSPTPTLADLVSELVAQAPYLPHAEYADRLPDGMVMATQEGEAVILKQTVVTLTDNLRIWGGPPPLSSAAFAANGGSVEIQGGSIQSHKSYTGGIHVSDGGHIAVADATIDMLAPFSHAVEIKSVDRPSRITLDRVTIRTDAQAAGIVAKNSATSVSATDTTIANQRSVGIGAVSGAKIRYQGGSITTDEGNAVQAVGTGAAVTRIDVQDGTQITVKGDGGFTGHYGVAASRLAQPGSGLPVLASLLRDAIFGPERALVRIRNSSIDIQGAHNAALYAGPGGAIHSSGNAIKVNSERTDGARAMQGGNIHLIKDAIQMEGWGGRALRAEGPGAQIIGEDLFVDARGIYPFAALADEGGTITLERGAISSQYIGLLASQDSKIVANQTQVRVSGEDIVGVGVQRGGTIELNGGTVVAMREDEAPCPPWDESTTSALFASGGASLLDVKENESSPRASTINAQDTIIHTHGKRNVGAKVGAAEDVPGLSAIINLDRVTIVTEGQASPAAEVGYGGTLHAKNSTLLSLQDNGIVVNDSGVVTLDATTLKAATSSIVSRLQTPAQTQHISITGQSDLKSDGTLLRVTRSAPGMDGVVNLNLSGSTIAFGDIVDTDGIDRHGERAGGGVTNFTVGDGAKWVGRQQGLHDIVVGDEAMLVHQGDFHLPGDLTAGRGSRVGFFEGAANIGGDVTLGKGNTTKFSEAATIRGSVRAAGATVYFVSEAAIGGDVVGDASEISFFQGGIVEGDVQLQNGARVSGGSLQKPLHIQGDAFLESGTVLSGNVRLAGALNAEGGILSPGNSVDEHVYGAYNNRGGTYVAEVNGTGQSDSIVVLTGDIDVSATTLSVSQENGHQGYRIDHPYTIFRAEGGHIVGQFASAGLDSTFDNTLVRLAPVTYNPHDVQIRLAVDADKIAARSATLTPNRANTLRGTFPVAGNNASAHAALLSAQLERDLDQLSGEIHPGTQSALLYSGGQVRQAIAQRLGGSAAADKPGVPLWTQATGGEFTLKGDGNAARTRTRSGGLFIGADTPFGAGTRVGVSLGYANGATSIPTLGSSKADVNTYTAALYGTHTWERTNGRFDLMAGTAYSLHHIDTRRHVMVGGRQTLKSDYDAQSVQVFAETGYRANVGTHSQVGPYVAVSWTRLKSDSFKESGGAAALRGNASRDSVFSTTLGVRGHTHFEMGSAPAYASGGLGWRHTAGHLVASRSMAFTADNAASFNVAGAPIAKNVAAVNLELGAEVGKNATLGLRYNGQFGKGLADNSGTLFFKVGF